MTTLNDAITQTILFTSRLRSVAEYNGSGEWRKKCGFTALFPPPFKINPTLLDIRDKYRVVIIWQFNPTGKDADNQINTYINPLKNAK
jgi:hypothetical protein